MTRGVISVGVGRRLLARAGDLDFGGVAQLGEHLLCKQGVVGSIPIASMSSLPPRFGLGVEGCFQTKRVSRPAGCGVRVLLHGESGMMRVSVACSSPLGGCMGRSIFVSKYRVAVRPCARALVLVESVKRAFGGCLGTRRR